MNDWKIGSVLVSAGSAMTVPSYSGPPSLPMIGTKSGQRPEWPSVSAGGDVPAEHLPGGCGSRGNRAGVDAVAR